MKIRLSAIAIVLLLAGCSKKNSGPSPITIAFQNNSFTPINLTVNGVSTTIAPDSAFVVTGQAGDPVSGTAQTSGLTSTNTVVGSVVSWNFGFTFPADVLHSTYPFNVPSTYFFLIINNQSSYSVTGLYVNYGLAAQSFDNITFGQGTFNIGYYPAFSNSNFRCNSSSGGNWQGNITSLTSEQNQSVIEDLNN